MKRGLTREKEVGNRASKAAAINANISARAAYAVMLGAGRIAWERVAVLSFVNKGAS